MSSIEDRLRHARTREALKARHPHSRAVVKPTRPVAIIQSCLEVTAETEVSHGSFDLTSSLGLGLEAMQSDPRFSDVTLVAGNERFSSHRMVLAIWSGYFRNMFSGLAAR